MAQYEDLEVDQGSDIKWQVKMLSTDGSPRDATGYTIRGHVNRSYDADSSEMLSFTTSLVPPTTGGIVEFMLTNTQTDAMQRRRYVYDLEVEFYDSASGTTTIERILEGNLVVSRSVSKFD
tara:strand:+ start:1360 stop:1722 length:363 start_codon:yes stop_codon:yes gene_type:complete